MITGYNTDVEHAGVIYHVQTEDKGLATPVILSLVYTGGAILASKRSPYDDLIAKGFDEAALTERLQRQHQLICAAVHAGRIDDLKRLGQREPEKPDVPPADISSQQPESGGAAGIEEAPNESDRKDRFSIDEAEDSQENLQIQLLDEKPLRAGESVTLRIEVSRVDAGKLRPVPKASVTLKTLGSHFQPSSTFSTTDSSGRSLISVVLPAFSTGRGAILIRAEAAGEVAELRRIISQA